MQRNMLPIITSVLIFLFSSAPAQAADIYTIDPAHTYVLWHISHFGFSNPSGKWHAEGTITADEAKPQDAKVNVTIRVGDIVTGIPKFDEHLKSVDFFDVAQYPTATFVSDKVDVTGKDTAKVHGTLTLHGVSKPVTLDVKLNKIGPSPMNNKKTVGFTAATTINRSDFGITKYSPGVGEEVKLSIEVEAKKAN